MSKIPPSVSIVIATFDSAEFLPRTIGSALNQLQAPREVIVVDDGSTDDTPRICARFGGAIRYLRQENRGVASARNSGAEHAAGEWLLFLDSDDILPPSSLASLLAVAGGNPAGVVYGMVLERREPPREPRLNGFEYCAGPPPLPAKRNFRRSVIITPGSAIVRRTLHEEIGGFVSGYEPMEDRDYWIKCGLIASVAFCRETVLDKTWRPASHGSQHAKRIFRGMLAKERLRGWCAGRGLDYSWAGADAVFIRDALQEALHWNQHEILAPLLEHARERHATGFWYWRSMLRKALLHFAGSLPPTPAWAQPPW